MNISDELFNQVATAFAIISATAGGAVTIYIYYRNSKLRRAEWLYSLFEKFFDQSTYREIRQILDHECADDMKRLQDTLTKDCEAPLEEKLVDYLNFFEFVASLWKLGQLPIKEIQMMFQYYLCRLADYPFLMEYIRKEGFEGLDALIAECRKERDCGK